jgi:hypothetical protein
MELGKLSTLGKLWKEHSREKRASSGAPVNLREDGSRPKNTALAARIRSSFFLFTNNKKLRTNN